VCCSNQLAALSFLKVHQNNKILVINNNNSLPSLSDCSQGVGKALTINTPIEQSYVI